MIKRLIILLVVLSIPFTLGLLITYEVIKVDWISFMEVQPSFRPQEAPLPVPAGSVPVDGAAYVAGMGAPVNPVKADDVSLQRGQELYNINCALCHGATGEGNGPFSAFLRPRLPANLKQGNALNGSDGAIFMVISNGVPGAMPPLRENLDPRSRWDVVNYVRSMQQKQP